MKSKLKLFVWEGALSDYTSGVMFAFAPDLKIARKMLKKKYNNVSVDNELKIEPKVYSDESFALSVWGGS